LKSIFKISYLRNIFIVSLVIAIILPVMIIFFIYPSFTVQLTKDTEDEAIRVARHLMTLVIPEKNELTRDSMTAEVINSTQWVIHDFKLMKLKIFSKSGEILYSTSSKDIGVINKYWYFHDLVAKGKVYTKVVKKNNVSLEDQIVTADVVETYVPIMKSNVFSGAFEIYYDITARKESLENLLLSSSIVLFVLVISFISTIIFALIRAANNIVRRELIEEELRESEKKFRTLYRKTPVMLHSIDREGRFVSVSDYWLDTLGYERSEVIGQKFIEFLTEESRRYAEEVTIPSFFQTGLAMEISCQFVKKNGEIIDILLSAIAESDSEGSVMVSLAVMSDITGQKLAEKEKTNLEAQLQQAFKMESIGTLAGGIAHDFNNILSPIMIHSEIVMDDLSDDSSLQFNMKEIFKASERARDLVKQILAFGRESKGGQAAVKITLIIKEVLKLLRSSIPTTIDIQYNFKTESDVVFADPTQVHQIILNLCTNASHAMRKKGGVLEIELDQLDLRSEAIIQFDGLVPGVFLRLTVRDTGHGIDPEIINKVFDPYFTTKEVGEGSGMGLAVVHGIVKRHGGDIKVESELGKGTTFYVLLPKSEADISPVEDHKIELLRGTERILLVDDEKNMIDAIQPMLENLGYKVTARTSSIDALEAFRYDPKAFDLIITDMTMPNMTGKELASELKRMRPDMPVILCTGFSDQIDEKRATKMGINAFIMKPTVKSEMAKTIRKVLDKR